MNDRALGGLIFLVSLAAIIAYIYWLFFPPPNWIPSWVFFYGNIRWALILPSLVAVVAILGIAMWIGWTMATTPPPTPIETPGEEEKAEEES